MTSHNQSNVDRIFKLLAWPNPNWFTHGLMPCLLMTAGLFYIPGTWWGTVIYSTFGFYFIFQATLLITGVDKNEE